MNPKTFQMFRWAKRCSLGRKGRTLAIPDVVLGLRMIALEGIASEELKGAFGREVDAIAWPSESDLLRKWAATVPPAEADAKKANVGCHIRRKS